ncbi:putative membrane protein [Mycobacterium intracellulare]|nr:putative membrane protein [Mycobacterium intracellulare]
MHMDEGLSTRQTLTAMGLGAVGALALSRIAGLARRGR